MEGLFELAHLEARETRPVCEPSGIAELLQDIVQKFQLRAREAGVALQMLPPDELPVVLADMALTERVLDNLIGNAIDHTPKGGEIQIELAVTNGMAQISVKDSGPGIAVADQPHIFEPFYRSRGADKAGRHAGLGLAIAKRMVELRGGRLAVESAPQHGACFCFTLPLATA